MEQQRQRGGYQAHLAAAIAGVVLAVLWLISGQLPALLSVAVNIAFGGVRPAPTTLVAFVVLEIGLAIGIYFRKRVAWILGVAFTAAQLGAMFVLAVTAIIGGGNGLVVGLVAVALFGTVFSLQLSAFDEMEPADQPNLMGAAIGVVSAGLWIASSLMGGRWTAASLAAFGGREVPIVFIVCLAALEVGLSVGIYFKNRAAWAFSMSLSATLALPLTIAIARLFWHREVVDAVAALFLHASLMVTQAIALIDRDALGAAPAAPAAP